MTTIMIFTSFYNHVWRFVKHFTLRKESVRTHLGSYFSKKTVFGGCNSLAKGANVSGSRLGRYTYLGKNSEIINSDIGCFTSIGTNVKVVSVTHPSSVFVSTSPAFFSRGMQCVKTFAKSQLFNERLSVNGRNVIIGNDVWIGNDVMLRAGVTIGDGAIIAMGAVVTKDVPPYSVWGGVPAKCLKMRFGEDQVKFLLKIKWWDKDDGWLNQHSEYFTDIDQLIKNIGKDENCSCNNS